MYLKEEDSVKIMELNNSSFIFDEVNNLQQFFDSKILKHLFY